MIAGVVWFWMINLFFIMLDVYGKPKFLLKYKVQKDKNNPVRSPVFQFFHINLFWCIVCNFVWIFYVAQVEGAAQWLPSWRYSMPSMGHLYRCSWAFRAKSQNNEKSNTELELFELSGCPEQIPAS